MQAALLRDIVVQKDNNYEDDSDEDHVDDGLHKTVAEIATKTDDSGFHSDKEDSHKVEVISGPGTTWTGKVPLYALKGPAVSFQNGMHTAFHSEGLTGSSFDTFVRECADGSGIGELMGGQALLRDFTTVAELKQLCELANEQVSITCCFNAKFSDMAFHLLQKIHKAFVGTSGIAQKFVNDMATIALNFIWDAATHEAELSASDGVVFVAWLACIRKQIADLVKKASALELIYEEAQKKFAGILEQVEKEVKEYMDTQSMADCTAFMDESFDSLCKFSGAFNVSPFIPVIVGMAITHHSLLTSLG